MGTATSNATGGSSGTNGNVGGSAVDGAGEFETRAKQLVAEYHGLRLSTSGGDGTSDMRGHKAVDAVAKSLSATGVVSLRSRAVPSATSTPSAERPRLLPHQVRRDKGSAMPNHDSTDIVLLEPPVCKG